jgi:hypothetical protein
MRKKIGEVRKRGIHFPVKNKEKGDQRALKETPESYARRPPAGKGRKHTKATTQASKIIRPGYFLYQFT